MPDKTTYESEMNTPAHRPGMEGVVNRGGKNLATHGTGVQDDPKDASGNREGARRTVAPPTQSAFGPRSASDPAPKAPAPAPAPAPSSDGSGIGGRMREQKIMDTVDDAAK